MTKRDLIMRISQETDFPQDEIKTIVQLTLDQIVNELAAGRNIEFRNFGVFKLAKQKTRVGRNPKAPTEEVVIPNRVTVKFKPGKIMLAKVRKLKPASLDKKSK